MIDKKSRDYTVAGMGGSLRPRQIRGFVDPLTFSHGKPKRLEYIKCSKGMAMETTRQLGNYRVSKSQTEFYCVHKPSLKRLISFCAFSMIWTIACVVLCFGAYQEGASFPLIFFAILFCIFECAILYSLLHTFFGQETLVFNSGGVLYHRSLFGFCKETAVPLVEIEKIIGDCEFGQSKDGVDGYLSVRSSFGQSITLVEHIPHHDLREMLGLIRETYERIRPNDSRCDEIFVFIEPKGK